MEWVVGILAILAIIFLAPVLLFRPLVLAISNRINGKQVDTEEVKLLRKKVEILEHHVMQMQGRVVAIEDKEEFSRKMIEDLSQKDREASSRKGN